jgi:hypothetical protein
VAVVGVRADNRHVKSERTDVPDPEEATAGIVARLESVDFGRELAEDGITTVALDDAGHLVEHRPDGTTARLTPRN